MRLERRKDVHPMGLIRWAVIGARGAVDFMATDANGITGLGLSMVRILGTGDAVLPFALEVHRLAPEGGWDLALPEGICDLTQGRPCYLSSSSLAGVAFLDAWVRRQCGAEAEAYEMLEVHYHREFRRRSGGTQPTPPT